MTGYNQGYYTSSTSISIPSEGKSIYLTGRLNFTTLPSFSYGSVPNCYASASASSSVYLKKHGSNEKIYLKGYSYLYYKSR